MRRIAAITQAVAFVVTGVLVLFALGMLATSHGGPRQALPELTLLGIALVAFLLASKPYVDADAEQRAEPVEVRLWDQQVDLLAKVVDSIVERSAALPGPRPIPNGVNFPQSGDHGVVIRETKLPRNGAKHRAVQR